MLGVPERVLVASGHSQGLSALHVVHGAHPLFPVSCSLILTSGFAASSCESLLQASAGVGEQLGPCPEDSSPGLPSDSTGSWGRSRGTQTGGIAEAGRGKAEKSCLEQDVVVMCSCSVVMGKRGLGAVVGDERAPARTGVGHLLPAGVWKSAGLVKLLRGALKHLVKENGRAVNVDFSISL